MTEVTVNQLDFDRADLLLGVQQKAIPNGSLLSALASEAMTELLEMNEKAQENITKRAEAEAKKAQEEAEAKKKEQEAEAKKKETEEKKKEDAISNPHPTQHPADEPSLKGSTTPPKKG